MNKTSTTDSERRQHHQIREIFQHACEFLAPVVTANHPVKTISNFAMGHMMQDRFPELLPEEIQIVIMTVEKMHREERLNAILNKKS